MSALTPSLAPPEAVAINSCNMAVCAPQPPSPRRREHQDAQSAWHMQQRKLNQQRVKLSRGYNRRNRKSGVLQVSWRTQQQPHAVLDCVLELLFTSVGTVAVLTVYVYQVPTQHTPRTIQEFPCRSLSALRPRSLFFTLLQGPLSLSVLYPSMSGTVLLCCYVVLLQITMRHVMAPPHFPHFSRQVVASGCTRARPSVTLGVGAPHSS